jgi:predicted short-subunit dehydrogenase-like oxidoreductase (DUF2520 family)
MSGPRARRATTRVVVVGAGKVGRALSKGLREARVAVVNVARRDLDRRASSAAIGRATMVILAVRDVEVERVARELVEVIAPTCVVLHTAGALGVDALDALHRAGFHVGKAHPLAAFASERRAPSLVDASLVIEGDRSALREARRIARALGMRPVVAMHVDPTRYHAAAALLANGAAALATHASRALASAGVPDAAMARMLGGLLRTVADNVATLGPEAALSGPVRRGDVVTIERHLASLREVGAEARALYAALVSAQLPIARSIGEATSAQLAAIDAATR